MGSITPKDACGFQPVSVRCDHVHRAITDHDRRPGHLFPQAQGFHLLPFMDSDISAGHKTEVLPQPEQCEDLFGEVLALRGADRHRDVRGAQSIESLGHSAIEDIFGIADLVVALAVLRNEGVDLGCRVLAGEVPECFVDGRADIGRKVFRLDRFVTEVREGVIHRAHEPLHRIAERPIQVEEHQVVRGAGHCLRVRRITCRRLLRRS